MIYNQKLTSNRDINSALKYIAELKSIKENFTLIDVGANANPWTRDFVTHTVDIEKTNLSAHQFTGNISDLNVWDMVLKYVEQHGKFDFLVSTHTIEDISAASMVCTMFSKIAKEGYIAVPSKYIELSRHEGPWRGYIHHRWIYDINGENFIGYPKQPFIEHMSYIDEWVHNNPRGGREELQFFWKDEIKLNVINNDHLGPTCGAVVEYYKQLTHG